MPAVAGDVMGLKLVSFYPINAGGPNPTHNATIVLYRTETGQPLAAMDGRLITEMRTAAVSAAVTARMASPSDARSWAHRQRRAGTRASPSTSSRADVRGSPRLEPYARTRGSFRAHARRSRRESPKAAVSGADVVVTVTSSRQPVVEGAWLKAGAHVNAVGSCRPDWRELDDEAMGNAVLVHHGTPQRWRPATSSCLARDLRRSSAKSSTAALRRRRPKRRSLSRSDLRREDLAAARLVADKENWLLASERPV